MTDRFLPPSHDGLDRLRDLVAGARDIVAFTGAGISTECGVPDFRSPGSPWLVHKPIAYQSFMASEQARREAWRRKFAMDDTYRHAEPGRGHAALAALHARGVLRAVVTQNIDNLHLRSGLPPEKVIELHGNGSYAVCLGCDKRHELADVRASFERTGEAPRCDACGGPVKSATISFGQPMPEDAMRRAMHAVSRCDLLLAIGSSLVVQPAARLPLIAKTEGAALVILNRDPTPLDGFADLVLRADIGDALSRVL
ncbi:NAD-dependent deacetylase [Alsobacter sp. SYSU M60028]|uniref:protein acetyllysine N-acetyltransferase n=1 Tax=Alsobacter ponti TaxID=2962936 RepID=A0ABT1LEM1_9HYPH|nr:Sir2 family NAD-dependent protein deacetylase [Alsobacter ponti]MCP8939904.1 NAD-dependent deacetylase [Alsobacter ponti]